MNRGLWVVWGIGCALGAAACTEQARGTSRDDATLPPSPSHAAEPAPPIANDLAQSRPPADLGWRQTGRRSVLPEHASNAAENAPGADPHDTQLAAPSPAADSNAAPAEPNAAPAEPNAAQPAPAGDAASATVTEDVLRLDGKAIQGGLVRGHVDGAVKRATFPGHKLVVADDGTFLVAFAREAPAKQTLTLELADGRKVQHVFDVEQRTYEPDVVNGLADDMVDPDPAMRAELAKVDARIEPLRRAYSAGIDCAQGAFAWPVKGRLTSRYGQPRVLNGKEGGVHWGVDIAANVGTPVKAPACGKVVFAETDVPLSGNTVIVDHGRGLTSTFLHLSAIAVKVGDDLKAGDTLGRVGATGRANGAHLDWRMNLFDTRIDPELLAPPMR